MRCSQQLDRNEQTRQHEQTRLLRCSQQLEIITGFEIITENWGHALVLELERDVTREYRSGVLSGTALLLVRGARGLAARRVTLKGFRELKKLSL